MERSETIVIVDDDREVRTLVEFALARLGRAVVGFASGDEALAYLGAADGVDLVISDVAMEGYDGHRLLRHLRSKEHTASTPVIFMTAGDEITERIGGVGERAVGYLRKPFEIAELRQRVDAAMHQGRGEGGLRDGVTGLHERSHFESALAKTLRESAQKAESVAVLVGSVHATPRNDGDGGAPDPSVLRRVAEIVGLHLRATDSAARLSDCEIVTLHPACDAAGATAIAQRILAAVAVDPDCAGARMWVGVAVVENPKSADGQAVLEAAGHAIREAKQSGDGRMALRTV